MLSHSIPTVIAAIALLLAILLLWRIFSKRAAAKIAECTLKSDQLVRDQEQLMQQNHQLQMQLDAKLLNIERIQSARLVAEKQFAAAQGELAYLPKLQQSLQEKEAELLALAAEHAALTAKSEQMALHIKEQQSLLEKTRGQLSQEFENLANRIFENKQQQFQQQSQQTLAQSIEPLKQQLGDFKKRVEDTYHKENIERNQLVGKIGELQKQTQKIGEDAVNLALALKGDNKVQGNWGEVVLERLLEESGLQKGREYRTQVKLADEQGKRRYPDVVVHLPESRDVVIDSKVSLTNYEAFFNATDQQQKLSYLKAHIGSIRTHIKELSVKNYESLLDINSLDFVLLFIPVEAAFMLALQEEPTLFHEAYNRHIVLVSPTTLMVTLRTVANIWRYDKQHKNAEKIAEQAGGLYDQFVLLVESLDELGKQLSKTQNSYQQIRKRLAEGRGNVITRVENLRKLGAKTKKVLAVDDAAEGIIDSSSGLAADDD